MAQIFLAALTRSKPSWALPRRSLAR